MKFADLIKEAQVSSGNEETAAIKVANFLGKKLGQDYRYINVEGYTNADGTHIGFLFIAPSSSAIRINWDDNKFRSINYWHDWATGKPDLEIFVNKLGPTDASFVQVLPKIAAAIQGDAMEESMLAEKAITYDGQTWNSPKEAILALAGMDWTPDQIKTVLKQNGNTYSIAQIQKVMGVESAPTTVATPEAHKAEIAVEPGKPERTLEPPSVKKATKELEKTKYADPEIVFEDLDSYTTMVAKGYAPAFLITGQGGIGKSYNVNKVLAQYGTKGEDYVIMKGKCTPIKMYKFLYNHYQQICVFDDCDSVFDSKDGINILKGVLDSGENREVNWDNANTIDTFGMTHEEIETALAEYAAGHDNKQAIPSYFEFEGAVIFISNLTYDDIYKKDRALPTRCISLDITLKAEDVINRIRTCLPNIKIYKAIKKRGDLDESKDITDEAMKQEVFEYMISDEYRKDPKFGDKEINFRTFSKIYMLRHAELPNWKRLAFAC